MLYCNGLVIQNTKDIQLNLLYFSVSAIENSVSYFFGHKALKAQTWEENLYFIVPL